MDDQDFHRIERKIDYIADALIGFSAIALFVGITRFGPDFFRTTIGFVLAFFGWLFIAGYLRNEYRKMK